MVALPVRTIEHDLWGWRAGETRQSHLNNSSLGELGQHAKEKNKSEITVVIEKKHAVCQPTSRNFDSLIYRLDVVNKMEEPRQQESHRN